MPSRVLASSDPTLIVNGDHVALLRDGRRVDANVGAPIYDPVKTVAHIPLAIYVTLTPGDGVVDDDRLKTLTGLRKLIPPAEASLDTVKLSAATLARQRQIVAASLAFLDDVAGRRRFARSVLLAFTRTSHGGNVTRRAVQLANVSVDGIIAVATPFVQLSPRNLALG